MVLIPERERINILMMRGWGKNDRSLEAVRIISKEKFAERPEPISKNTVKRTIDRFNLTRSVKVSYERRGAIECCIISHC